MAAFIDAALRSIRRQDLEVHEVVLIDTGSTDATIDIANRHLAEGMNLKLLSSPGSGPGPARNVGLGVAEGDLIAFLDADDLWPAGKLARQLARLEAEPRVEMVTGYICYFETADDDGLQPAPDTRTERIFHVHLGACLYRREVFDRIGRFDEDFLYGEDVDLMLRLREQAVPFTILRSIELYYRRHPASMMASTNPRQLSDFRRAAFKSLQRRRAAGTHQVPLPDFSAFLEPQG